MHAGRLRLVILREAGSKWHLCAELKLPASLGISTMRRLRDLSAESLPTQT